MENPLVRQSIRMPLALDWQTVRSQHFEADGRGVIAARLFPLLANLFCIVPKYLLAQTDPFK